MTYVLVRERQRDIRGLHVRTEAEIGVVPPQAKEHVDLQKPEEAGGILPGSRRASAALLTP